jgi:hypothetical protein
VLGKPAESAALRSVAVETADARAQLLFRVGDHSAAEQEANRTITAAETLGLRLVQAKAHYVRGAALRAAKNADARREFAAALRLFEHVRSDVGNDKVLERADIAPLYKDSRSEAGAS